MKAVRFDRHGGPEVLRYGDETVPQPGTDEVLVRVSYTSVSGWDVKYREGHLPRLPGRPAFPLPMQPGRDTVGVVEAVGARVVEFAPGDRVIGLVHPENHASVLAVRGLGNLSPGVRYPAHTMFGGCAQFVARPAAYWLPLPETVDERQGAAALWSYATSRRLLLARGHLRVGDTLLVVGASGGMGTATLDLARLMGVRVTAITRSSDKAAFLSARGADRVIVLGEDAAASVTSAGGTLGFDAAVDFSGTAAMVTLCLNALRPGGTLLILAGEHERQPLPITASDCIRLELNLHGVRGSTRDDQRAIVDLLARGMIDPEIHAIMPMSEIAAAQALVSAGDVRGRILLDPWQ